MEGEKGGRKGSGGYSEDLYGESCDDSGSDDDPAVVVNDLNLTYSDGTEAVKDVSMEVPRGQFFGFLGPNGAGKTTTIKVLATLLSPTDGEVRLNGYDVAKEPQKVRESIGYMAQETSVDEELTARENLRFSCRAYGVERGRREERIDELLELVGLVEDADTKAGEFSGGMKKRLDAATSLVHRPPIVFLDEPTTGLDPKARNDLWDYFIEINDEGTTILLTTQYLDEADYLCEKLSVIRDGVIVAEGSPAELKKRVGGELLDVVIDGGKQEREEALDTVRRTEEIDGDVSVESNPDGLTVSAHDVGRQASRIMAELEGNDVTVAGFSMREPTLDDVFLAITDDSGEVEDTDREMSPEGEGGTDTSRDGNEDGESPYHGDSEAGDNGGVKEDVLKDGSSERGGL
ncbi:MAG: ATP-binding cassette domain-containing protein [Halobacteria archaeon]